MAFFNLSFGESGGLLEGHGAALSRVLDCRAHSGVFVVFRIFNFRHSEG